MDTVPDIVDLVLWVLAFSSLVTWTIMIIKFWELRGNALANRQFKSGFDKLDKVDGVRSLLSQPESTLSDIARAGLDELQSHDHAATSLDAKDRREMLFHALRQQIHLSQSRLENGLAVFASVGSTSPFIGLFGTVWGIMHALKSITVSGSAGLDVVAGPIGEALVATALGIAAAIPAVLAYNFFLRKVRLAVTEMEHFSDRFIHLVIRSGSGGK